ncbi:hypothetical protein [Paracnuella aquatica]|uniref:hypothetical protein n=1 Tax=Paracnuella aquatica TaxID=2268757 RepID=UPI000DEF8239|nr:hypothetical protein [Paracnuella aquatica]RPD44821.1 hypothetical protein DRJ53_16870 [Paracnuella aquatica]
MLSQLMGMKLKYTAAAPPTTPTLTPPPVGGIVQGVASGAVKAPMPVAAGISTGDVLLYGVLIVAGGYVIYQLCKYANEQISADKEWEKRG